jgi:replicative DNA helicase
MTPLDDGATAEGRVPPHHLDAEKAVLGAILVDGRLFETAAEFLTDPLDFYRYAHQVTFRTMRDLAVNRVEIDYLTLKDALLKIGKLDDVGGPAYLTSLADGVPRGSNVGEYARIVRDYADRRRLIHAATKVIAQAHTTPTKTRAS